MELALGHFSHIRIYLIKLLNIKKNFDLKIISSYRYKYIGFLIYFTKFIFHDEVIHLFHILIRKNVTSVDYRLSVETLRKIELVS